LGGVFLRLGFAVIPGGIGDLSCPGREVTGLLVAAGLSACGGVVIRFGRLFGPVAKFAANLEIGGRGPRGRSLGDNLVYPLSGRNFFIGLLPESAGKSGRTESAGEKRVHRCNAALCGGSRLW
jgi:hypothetical protein